MNNPALLTESAAAHRRKGVGHAITALFALVTLVILSPNGPLRAAVTHSQEQTACEGSKSLFPRSVKVAAGTTIVTQWSARYHDRVRTVLQEYLQQLRNGGACEATVRTVATPALRKLAEDMEWEEVHQEDVPAVLLEYLRLYGCALQDETLLSDQRAETDIHDRAREAGETFMNILDAPIAAESARIDARRELAIARSALHRTLLYLSGYGRLQPMSSSLQCLEGATADIANNMRLVTEASACMPRIWDARTSLRTLPAP